MNTQVECGACGAKSGKIAGWTRVNTYTPHSSSGGSVGCAWMCPECWNQATGLRALFAASEAAGASEPEPADFNDEPFEARSRMWQPEPAPEPEPELEPEPEPEPEPVNPEVCGECGSVGAARCRAFWPDGQMCCRNCTHEPAEDSPPKPGTLEFLNWRAARGQIPDTDEPEPEPEPEHAPTEPPAELPTEPNSERPEPPEVRHDSSDSLLG